MKKRGHEFKGYIYPQPKGAEYLYIGKFILLFVKKLIAKSFKLRIAFLICNSVKEFLTWIFIKGADANEKL